MDQIALFSPVVHGYIVLSINIQHTIKNQQIVLSRMKYISSFKQLSSDITYVLMFSVTTAFHLNVRKHLLKYFVSNVSQYRFLQVVDKLL